MDTRVTFPESIRLLRAVRGSDGFSLARLGDRDGGDPDNSFVRVEANGTEPVVIESPERSIVAAASCLAPLARAGSITEDEVVIRVASLADELCGRWSRDPVRPQEADPIAYDIDPVTSASLILDHLGSHTGQRGVRLARKALAITVDNLGSPLEALTELLLCAPPALAASTSSSP